LIVAVSVVAPSLLAESVPVRSPPASTVWCVHPSFDPQVLPRRSQARKVAPELDQF
jgi:hypothetical protein